ncbi:hypothetical protein [Actinacidiphila oryziradicis]|uniref:hypothetical protein n=1 Tax=Actinacidiphila oryziradicis TaxID=2571141 RepID=UPI00145E9DD1|nr:hypothetical protein [Actinacidiphila oryziradicis]
MSDAVLAGGAESRDPAGESGRGHRDAGVKQLADAEAELARVAAAEQVVAQLLAEDAAAGEAARDDDSATATVVEPGRVVPYRKDAAGPRDLSAEYQRVLQEVAAAGGPVRCKQMCERLGIGTEPRKVEAMRARMKRLADRGWLREGAPGLFTMPG